MPGSFSSRRSILVLVLVAAGTLPARGQQAASTPPAAEPWIAAHRTELDALYKHLHTHPELSFQEHETARRIAEELRKAGAEVTTGVGRVGVVGVLRNGPGPVVLVRTDMDALPVTEETGLLYASRQKATDKAGRSVGVMHACGHDVHMTCFVGTARWLADHKDRWSGTVLLVAQPAEEAIGGARAMLDDGLYSRFPRPTFALALHCTADQPTGTVHYCPGPMLASSTSVLITLRGKGGHGAWPHRTVDPIVLASLVVLDLQTIVSREIAPGDPAVVTVGSIHGGTRHNIIPDEVKLQLTLRAFSESVRQQLLEGIRRRVDGLAKAHRAPEPSVVVEESTPPTINSPDLVERVVAAFREAFASEKVIRTSPVMGAEDFGLFGEGKIPVCMFWIGTIDPARIEAARTRNETLPALHSSKYYPDPGPSIETGLRAMTSAVVKLLPVR